MSRKMSPENLAVRPFQLLDRQWGLLVAGLDRPNPMTVSWGGFGTLWNRNVVTVYVRHSRFTFGLLSAEGEFTLNFFPERRRRALEQCGTLSGRDVDKWMATGLTPVTSERVGPPRVAEANLSLECRVLASTDLAPGELSPEIRNEFYTGKEPHRMFVGEVLAVWASERYAD